ncbi:hypothetical protein PPL_07814 [Heterostelium album PN500]|uniref:Uncharacterized protein n=1 Tax=Heterostelium pallidum (strain ATCC 26659 / Pp 5 / PN500) TaxID=670386 RepID=D3BH12_HETP5|nr:hypothetical protein PPL_07814 [Heterostelium album PN500]EFA79396.1 hypothetical protein PPL_07814 [Heterostelium album PN500]|eukprot:XP_020431517.1 hypothetical protein PPL_07814 [Heterostelium album PN500]
MILEKLDDCSNPFCLDSLDVRMRDDEDIIEKFSLIVFFLLRLLIISISRYFMSMNWYDNETELLFPDLEGNFIPENEPNSTTTSGNVISSKTCDSTILGDPTKFRVDFYGPNFMNSSQVPNIYIKGLISLENQLLFHEKMPGNSTRSLIQFETALSSLTKTKVISGEFGIYVRSSDSASDTVMLYTYTPNTQPILP